MAKIGRDALTRVGGIEHIELYIDGGRDIGTRYGSNADSGLEYVTATGLVQSSATRTLSV